MSPAPQHKRLTMWWQRSPMTELAERPATHRYAVSIAIMACAAGLQFLYEANLGPGTPFIVLYPAALICGWYGGFGPGLLAAAIGVLGTHILLLPSAFQPYPFLRVGVFVTTAILAAAVSESMHRARRQATRTVEMVKTQMAAGVELQQMSAHLAAIVDSSEDAIISKSLDGIIHSWNFSAERLLGYTAEQAVGRHISLIIPVDRAEEENIIVAQLRAGKRVEHFDTVRVRSDGRPIQVSLTISPIKDETGVVVGASKIMRDVTEKKEAERRIRELMTELTEADRRKDEFLAMLGHELRNPLSAVRNAVATASLDEARRPRALEIARHQTDQLGRLIDDLLDVARITQGRITLRKERSELGPIIQRAVDSMRPFINARGLRLAITLAPEIIADVDPPRLEQVFGNILSNATKYTDKGGQIDVVAERHAEQAVVSIRDTGIGITPAMLPHIWDLFTQEERGLDRAQGGLGVGLTVARRLVELHGGRVEAHSEGLGKGTTLVVSLPMLSASWEEARTVAPDQSLPAPPARILVVEDNPATAESLTMLLELFGHHVRVLHDGLSALEEAHAIVPDVMLVDIGLPGIDGYEVARRVREDPVLKHVGLVALTGYGRDEDKQLAKAAGFDFHLVKPVNPDALRGLVAQFGKNGMTQPPTVH